MTENLKGGLYHLIDLRIVIYEKNPAHKGSGWEASGSRMSMF